MTRTFRYSLRPTKIQLTIISFWLLKCCELYNAALQERKDAWNKNKKSIGRYDQHKSLTEIRRFDSEWSAIPLLILRSSLNRLDNAFQGFFRRVKNGEKPGYPRFRSRDRYDSFSIGRSKIEGNQVHIPRMGMVRFHEYRPLKGTLKECYLKRTYKGWYVCFVMDLGKAPEKITPKTIIGIDVGLEFFATFSNGKTIDNPRYFKQGEELLAKRQRSLARKRRGSNSRKKVKLLVGRAYEHIHNQKLYFCRKQAKILVNKADVIVHEDLNIQNMIDDKFAKLITDASWGLFFRCIAYKVEETGKYEVKVDPMDTSQLCSRCGALVPKDLSVRIHHCSSCGFTVPRDLNSALEIESRGLKKLGRSFGLLTRVPDWDTTRYSVKR
jgi:putative transposase